VVAVAAVLVQPAWAVLAALVVAMAAAVAAAAHQPTATTQARAVPARTAYASLYQFSDSNNNP
jgi:hypothetical protein